MSYREKYIGEAPIKNSPKKALGLVLKDGAVTNSKIASGSVTNDKLAPESVDESKLAPELADRINESTIDPNQIAWIDEQMLKELKEEANKKFIITTSPENNSVYYADKVSSKQMTIKVYTTFDGDPVDCGQVGDWQHTTGTNEYTKTITASEGSGAICASQEFKFTIQSKKYSGIEVSGKSTERKITSIQPFYYGLAHSNDINRAYAVIEDLEQSTSDIGSDIYTGESEDGSSTWFWMIVPIGRTISVTQMGQPVPGTITEISMVSPWNSSITLYCNVYISEKNVVYKTDFKYSIQ